MNLKKIFLVSIIVLFISKSFASNPVSSGHIYKTSTVNAKSGRNNYAFFSKKNCAWRAEEKREKKFIKLMKKASNIMLIANEPKGSQTVDHYSMIGFSKAYETAKKNCS